MILWAEPALMDLLKVTDAHEVRVLLIGALARDLCLPEARRMAPRKTQDADVLAQLDSWETLDSIFEGCRAQFEVRVSDYRLIHRPTGVPIDLLPCGGVEAPPGQLRLHHSGREECTVGMFEAFLHARALGLGDRVLYIPTPAAFVVLKLMTWFDRRAPRDLQDIAYVLRHAPQDLDRIYEDDAAMEGMVSGSLDADSVSAWLLGRCIQDQFTPETVKIFCERLNMLLRGTPGNRAGMIGHWSSIEEERDQRLISLDRQLWALLAACSSR